MRPVRVLAAGLALVAGCGDRSPIEPADVAIRVSADPDEVECGRAFGVTVVLVWRADLEPDEWSDRSLAPLDVHLVEVRRREDDRRVEETRRYVCRAFSLDDVAIAAPSFSVRPRGGGPPLVANGAELRIRVKPSLDRAAPGSPELPGEPLRERFPWAAWMAGAVALVVVGAVVWRLARRRPSAAAVAPPPLRPSAHARALERLARLGDAERSGAIAAEPFHVEAADLVRELLEEGFEIRAPEMTTEEFLGSPRTSSELRPEHRALLGDFLARCDLVKFGREPSTPADRAALFASAERFVRETSGA